MVEIRGVETGGLSGRNQENLVPHVQRSKGMEASYVYGSVHHLDS